MNKTTLSPYDPANHTFINVKWYVRDPEDIIIETSIFLPVVVFGLFGNVMVIYILVKNRHIQTPTNLLIGNMAVADSLSLLIFPWMVVIYDSFQNYELGAVGCRGETAVECILLIASVVSMSAITYDRLTAIILPKETRLNRKGAKIVIAVTWIAGILLSVPFMVFRSYQERQWLDFLEKYCTERTDVNNIYYFVIITVLVWVPLSIQIICYISIFIKLSKYEKQLQKRLEHHQVNYKKRAAKMMFIVTVTFMICRLPFTAYIIYRHQLLTAQQLEPSNQVQNQANGTMHTLWFTSYFSIFVNAALNPIIYGITNEKFLRAFRTTKLAIWFFPAPRISKTVTIQPKPAIIEPKFEDSTSEENRIFCLFRKKPKSVAYQAHVTTTQVNSRTP